MTTSGDYWMTADTRLAVKTRRVLRRDGTVAHGGQLYQIHDRLRATHVLVEEWVDGTRRIRHRDHPVTYQPILTRPRPVVTPPSPRRPWSPVKPPTTHPWNRFGTFATDRPVKATI
jgi:hypothetical protein